MPLVRRLESWMEARSARKTASQRERDLAAALGRARRRAGATLGEAAAAALVVGALRDAPAEIGHALAEGKRPPSGGGRLADTYQRALVALVAAWGDAAGGLLDDALLAAVRSARALRSVPRPRALAEAPAALPRLLCSGGGSGDDALESALAQIGPQVGARRLLVLDDAGGLARVVGWRATARDSARATDVYAWLRGNGPGAGRAAGVVVLPLTAGGAVPFGILQAQLADGDEPSLRALALLGEILAAALDRRQRLRAALHEVRGHLCALRLQLEQLKHHANGAEARRWGASAGVTLDEADGRLRSLLTPQPRPARGA